MTVLSLRANVWLALLNDPAFLVRAGGTAKLGRCLRKVGFDETEAARLSMGD